MVKDFPAFIRPEGLNIMLQLYPILRHHNLVHTLFFEDQFCYLHPPIVLRAPILPLILRFSDKNFHSSFPACLSHATPIPHPPSRTPFIDWYA